MRRGRPRPDDRTLAQVTTREREVRVVVRRDFRRIDVVGRRLGSWRVSSSPAPSITSVHPSTAPVGLDHASTAGTINLR